MTKLDRLGRSVWNLEEVADPLEKQGIGLKALSRGIDMTTPGGRLFSNMLAAIAEFESDLIRARTREGMAVAKANGRLRGRQPKLSVHRRKHLLGLVDAGEHTQVEMAESLGVSGTTVYREIQRRVRTAAQQPARPHPR